MSFLYPTREPKFCAYCGTDKIETKKEIRKVGSTQIQGYSVSCHNPDCPEPRYTIEAERMMGVRIGRIVD